MKPIQDVFTIVRRGRHFVALFAVILALAGLANADSSHKKKGNFSIAMETEVGGSMLQPEDYEVKEVNSPGGPVLEFVHLFYNELAPEGIYPYEAEVVARVPFTAQALSSLAKKTRLLLASNNSTSNTRDAIGLEIRGNDVAYVIAGSMLNAKSETRPDAKVDCANNGMQE